MTIAVIYTAGQFSEDSTTVCRQNWDGELAYSHRLQVAYINVLPLWRRPHYNSAILSRLLIKYEASGNAKALSIITQVSPAAWRHIYLNGHSIFRSMGQAIAFRAIGQSWMWADGKFWVLGLHPPTRCLPSGQRNIRVM